MTAPTNGWILATIFFAIDWLIRVGLSIRVIMRRRPVGVSLAWLALVLIVPFVGAVAYLFLGELRLGRRRVERALALHASYGAWLSGLERRYPAPAETGATDSGLSRMIQAGTEIPPLPGNAVHLLEHFEAIFAALIADIDRAARLCHLEFYIWAAGGLADDVVEALVRASGRGVDCRVLVDDVGSAAFLKSPQAGRLREGGVQLRAALPVSLVRGLFRRADLRLHRKIVVIDGEVAYTGSQNLVDPRFFKQDAGVGAWIDAMARVEGPAVEALWATFLEDWALESPGGGTAATEATPVLPALSPRGDATVQVLPSGPSSPPEAMRMVVLAAIYEARRELVLTTPYFIPDEPLLMAMASAALRGVAVTLIMPAKNDSRLVDLASRAFQGDLARAGVRVMLFEGGLLHTKSISIDGRRSLFGSLNLDPRSLELNFEITLAIYDEAFTRALRSLQQSYIDRARPLDLDAWQARPAGVRLAENAARLAGPLL
jgi:cardiolipin synthase